ncbi:hypothetical protein AB1K70_07270 [Bremerella sp. JC770]
MEDRTEESDQASIAQGVKDMLAGEGKPLHEAMEEIRERLEKEFGK